MTPYVLMVQADPDDQYITESTLHSINREVMIQYAQGMQEVDAVTAKLGNPIVILVNDGGSVHPAGELLRSLKTDTYREVPTVVLGEVSTPDYIRKCYAAGASTFITKPSTVRETQQKIATFFSYWLEVAG